jgi:hypothetical protein
MALVNPQNRATDAGGNLIPDMPGYQDFRHKPFGYMRTEQDQIWWLYWHFSTLATQTDYDDMSEEVADLQKQVSDLWDAINQIRGDMNDLKALMCALATNALTYDVTKGLYTASMAQARREWQAQMFYGMTVEDLAGFTVAQAESLNVRHIAVDGRYVYMDARETIDMDPEIPWQDAYSCSHFNPDEYVKKSDLTLIDTDNLEEHTIMGVLTKDAASDFVTPTPYARPYTTKDLNESFVLFNDHVVTDYPGRGQL